MDHIIWWLLNIEQHELTSPNLMSYKYVSELVKLIIYLSCINFPNFFSSLLLLNGLMFIKSWILGIDVADI